MEISKEFVHNFIFRPEEYLKKDEDRDFIIKNFYRILKTAYFEKVNIYYILKKLYEIPEINEKITKRPEYVIACSNSSNIINVLGLLKDNESLKKILERRFVGEGEERIIDDTIISKFTNISVQDLRRERILPFLKQLFNEILEKENMNIGDIVFIDKGTTAAVYSFGSVVIKLGQDKREPVIPYHPNIMMPILRLAIPKRNNEDKVQNITDTFFDNDKLLFIEIQQNVRKLERHPLTWTTTYNLRKFLKEDGIIWGDESEENICILKNFDNIPRYGEVCGIDYKFYGIRKEKAYDENHFYKEDENRVLIIDADDIAYLESEER